MTHPAPVDAGAGSAALSWGDVIIIGGGCYGTFYVRQLERAAELGKVRYARLLVVDRNPACQTARELGPGPHRELVARDWGGFLDDYLASPESRSGLPGQIVPSPLMPHLMYEWLVRRARLRWPSRQVVARPVPAGPGTPYDMQAPDGTRYVSFADWLCPTHCIEPAICPVIRGPRTWEMSEAAGRLAQRLAGEGVVAEPVLFACQHQVFGVGTFGVADVLGGDLAVTLAGASGAPVSVLVGTISSCHGALSLLHLGQA
ncbi:MAG TPA: hypothetical protein VJN95_03995 [Gemmatimonadales bacterium]|nr:hypothetical protein [Gemmatimonadales bacterium]